MSDIDFIEKLIMKATDPKTETIGCVTFNNNPLTPHGSNLLEKYEKALRAIMGVYLVDEVGRGGALAAEQMFNIACEALGEDTPCSP